MIQDIYPHIMNNTYQPSKIKDNDYLFVFRDDQVLMKDMSELYYIPTLHELRAYYHINQEKCVYMFSIDDESFYILLEDNYDVVGPFQYANKNDVNKSQPWAKFAFAVALHLHHFYDTHRRCGRCGEKMHPDDLNRAMVCDNCHNMVFPTISPAIICAIIHEDKIVLSKYAGREFKDYALIAGFCEIGETLEECVRREVMEEVGLHIKDIKYFGSQPWPYSQSMMVGFSAHLDGSDKITLEEEELSEAGWFKRDEMPKINSFAGLTQEMMLAFKEGKLK